MAETISTKYGIFNMIGSMGDCEGCHFNNPSGDCKRPEDFGHKCTSPKDVIFQLLKVVPEDTILYTDDKKYYLIEQSGCTGCCFCDDPKTGRGCNKPSLYGKFECTETSSHKSGIFKKVENTPVKSILTRVGMRWNLKDGENYVIAAKADDHNSCLGCCFEDDCNISAVLPEVDCAQSEDEIVFLLNGKAGEHYCDPKAENMDVIGNLMIIRQNGMVRVAKETSKCNGCWFYRNCNCDKNEWKNDSDFPDTCNNIIFTLDVEPDHDDPNWDDDDEGDVTEVPFVEEDEPEDDHPGKIYEGRRFLSPDGIHLKYSREAETSSCAGCYFKRRDCGFHKIGIPDHDGWILVEDILVKCGDGILAQIRKPDDVRLVLDMGITKSKSTPNMSLKKEKKFSI